MKIGKISKVTRALYKDAKSGKYTMLEIARGYNICREAVSGIKHGRNWG